jgi:uncharacterized protein YdgA (DUF945 family)
MKKVLIIPIIIVLLFIAWLGGSWYSGGLIEKQLKQMPQEIAKASFDDKLSEISYSRGLLTTHARYNLSNTAISTEPIVEMDVTIWHGPFPLRSLTKGTLLPQKAATHVEVSFVGPIKQMADPLLGGKPLISIDVACGFSNECSGSGVVPPINAENLDVLKNTKINFDGLNIKYVGKYKSTADFNIKTDAQILPLSINSQNMGSGQITSAIQPTNFTEMISWKTEQGTGNISISGEFSRPLTTDMGETMSAADLAALSSNPFKFIKAGSIKVDVSKTMVIDLAARIVHLTKEVDLESARQQISMQFDTILNNAPEVKKYITLQDNKITADWNYTGDKLIINGQENPEILAAIKSGALSMIPKDATGESTDGSNENQTPEQSDSDGDGDGDSDKKQQQ